MLDNVCECDVTFVITGSLFDVGQFPTLKTLQSVKKHFPQSKIILSTWKNSSTSLLKKLEPFCDAIILSTSPKLKYSCCLESCSWYPKLNSYDAQQLCTHKALLKVKTKYACRLRSDFYFFNNNLLQTYNSLANHFPNKKTGFTIFEQKVLIHELGSINSETPDLPLIFHPSEIFHFGLTSDLLKLWDGIPIPDEIADYFHNLHNTEPNPCLFNHRFTPEQYIWLKLINRIYPSASLPSYYLDISPNLIESSNEFLVSNYVIGTAELLGIKSKFDNNLKLYRHRFENPYTYCLKYNRIYPMNCINKEITNIFKFIQDSITHKVKMYKHCYALLDSLNSIKLFFKRPLLIVYHYMKSLILRSKFYKFFK